MSSVSWQRRCALWVLWLWCPWGLAACGGDSTGDSTVMSVNPDSAEQQQDSGMPSVASGGAGKQLIGTFSITLIDESAINGTEAFSSVLGVVRDGPAQERMGWELADEARGCRLEIPHFPLCDPRCGAGMACVGDNVCEAEPAAVSVGEVTIRGAQLASGESEFSLMQIGPAYQPESGVDIAYPPSAEGAELTLSATGGDHGPFDIRTTGIAPLQVSSSGDLILAPDQALHVTWEPPSASANSQITAVVDISHHGGIKGRIVCEVDDQTGELEIDAALVTKLIELGTAGFPIITLNRRSVGSTAIDIGRIDFAIEQHRELALQIPGVTSCLQATDCPEGQSCMPDRRCE